MSGSRSRGRAGRGDEGAVEAHKRPPGLTSGASTSSRSGACAAITSMASCRYRYPVAWLTFASRASRCTSVPSTSHRSTSTAWVRQVAARCHGRESTRLRWAWSQRDTRATVSIGTGRVARYSSTRGLSSRRLPGRNQLWTPRPRVSQATRQSHWHHSDPHPTRSGWGETSANGRCGSANRRGGQAVAGELASVAGSRSGLSHGTQNPPFTGQSWRLPGLAAAVGAVGNLRRRANRRKP